MITPLSILIGLIVITAIIDLILVFRPTVTREQGGKILAFAGVLLLPALIGSFALETHMENSKKTEFCLSCHVMEDYGKSLHVDDGEYVPAAHFQNHRIPHEQACFTCHTEYTMFGDYAAKLRGLRHIYYQYIGTIPDTIKLYSAYNNRECLHCHENARAFEEKPIHNQTITMMDSIKHNQMSCMTSGCHDVIHDVKNIAKATLWKPMSAVQRAALAPKPDTSAKSGSDD
jgi:nitrate/TMAO reductase-like tetraheme cytochrome c subunit